VVTVLFVSVVFLNLWGGVFYGFFAAIFVAIICVVGYLAVKSRDDVFFQQTIREGTFVVILSSVFGGINGVLLSNLGPSLAAMPGLMTMYPALTNALGNVGSIIGSKTTTDIALGYSKSFMEELKESGKRIVQVEVPAAFMNVVFGVIAFILSIGQGAALMPLIGVALSSNLMSFIIITVFALWSAHLSFERGLNPDNVVIPAITSVSDTTVTLALTPAIMVSRLLGF